MLPSQRSVRTVSAVLHGVHPLHGRPVTYTLTPLERQPGMPAGFMVEEDDGGATTRVMMTSGQVRALVERVTYQAREAALSSR